MKKSVFKSQGFRNWLNFFAPSLLGEISKYSAFYIGPKQYHVVPFMSILRGHRCQIFGHIKIRWQIIYIVLIARHIMPQMRAEEIQFVSTANQATVNTPHTMFIIKHHDPIV